MTVSSWADKNLWSSTAKNLLNQAVKGILTVEAKDCSYLYWMHYIRGAARYNEPASIMRLAEVANGAQQDRIKGGSYVVSIKLSEKLKEGTIVLNEPVTQVKQNEDNVTIITKSQKQYKCKYVIMALSPMLTGRIEYDPPLPSNRDELTQRFSMGRVIKCLIFYKDSFWLKKGFSGEILSENGEFTMGFECTLYDGKHPSLVVFICGDHARKLSLVTENERKKKVLEELSKVFGEEAMNAIHYIDKDWLTEPYARGAYTGVCGPGVLSSLGDALRKPVGRIHWSGTETARVWSGYMEGALESAERVALEVTNKLQGNFVEQLKKPFPVKKDPILIDFTYIVSIGIIILSYLLYKLLS